MPSMPNPSKIPQASSRNVWLEVVLKLVSGAVLLCASWPQEMSGICHRDFEGHLEVHGTYEPNRLLISHL